MEEILDIARPKEKVYKESALWLGTFFGGPLVAGYILAKNFRSLGDHKKVQSTWIITIIATIMIFGFILISPEETNIPNQIFVIPYTVIAYSFFTLFQKNQLKKYIEAGATFYDWGRVVVLSLIGSLITFLLFFSLLYLFDTQTYVDTKIKSYGALIKHEIEYETDLIKVNEVDKIAEGFRKVGFFDFEQPKYVYLSKYMDTYIISIPIIKGAENDQEAMYYFEKLREDMDYFLSYNNVEINLIVDYLENVVKVLR